MVLPCLKISIRDFRLTHVIPGKSVQGTEPKWGFLLHYLCIQVHDVFEFSLDSGTEKMTNFITIYTLPIYHKYVWEKFSSLLFPSDCQITNKGIMRFRSKQIIPF